MKGTKMANKAAVALIPKLTTQTVDIPASVFLGSAIQDHVSSKSGKLLGQTLKALPRTSKKGKDNLQARLRAAGRDLSGTALTLEAGSNDSLRHQAIAAIVAVRLAQGCVWKQARFNHGSVIKPTLAPSKSNIVSDEQFEAMARARNYIKAAPVKEQAAPVKEQAAPVKEQAPPA